MDALRPSYAAPISDGEPSAPGTPGQAQPVPNLYAQRKPLGLVHTAQQPATAYASPLQPPSTVPHAAPAPAAQDAGLDEQQIENLRTMLAHIAPDRHEHSFPYDPYSAEGDGGAPIGAPHGSDSSRNISTPSLDDGARGRERTEVIETMDERTAGKRAMPPSDAASIATEGSEARLVANLSASDVQFLISNQEPEPPSLDQLRDRVTKQFPYLLHRYEPEAKTRKPHENPPAVDKAVRARFKPLTPEEESVLLSSLRVSVDSVMEQSVMRGVVVLEKRESVWKPLGPEPPAERVGMVERVERVPPLPSAWLLPIDASAHIATGKAKSKKIFRLPEFEAMSSCMTCDGQGQRMCPLCRNADPDECFWCDGTGIRKRKTCDNCHGRKIHACLKCDARGTIECKECGGNGQVYVGAFVEVKFRSVSLPPIAIKDLSHPGTGMPPTTPEEVAQCSKLKMAQTIHELARTQANKASPSVPVLARCVWHKSVKRTVSIWRPRHVEVPGARKLGRHHHNHHHHHHHDAPDEGDLHRFLISSDKSGPVVEINAATAAAAATGRSGISTPNPIYLASGSNTPSASVANLQALWRGGQPNQGPNVPPVPANH